MKIQKKSFVIILVLLFSSLSLSMFAFTIATSAKTTLPDYEPMRMGPEFRDSNLPVYGEIPSSIKTSGGLHTSVDEYYIVGDFQYWLSLDNYYGYYYWSVFELRAMNDLAEIWVQTNLSYGWAGNYPPIFGATWSDPRDDPVVTDDQIEYLLDEFTYNIYPKDTAYFGTPDILDATNAVLYPEDYQGSSREVILVSNVKDDAYYDPTYPYYIAGFYSPTFEYYFDRNIISIDSHDWENRIGPDVDRPNLYESIIAHEYQHLIHDDYFMLSETWMNEACSLFAEPLCGYELDMGQVEYFLETPDNSLTVWGDQGPDNILADYGAAFLWALYLTDHYGIDFLSDYVEQGIAGIEGINLLLPNNVDFHDVFHDWRIANLIDADCGKYGYQLDELQALYNPDAELNLHDVWDLHIQKAYGEEIPWTSASAYFGETITHPSFFYPDGMATGHYDIGPFGTEYISFTDLEGLNFLKFDGDQEAIYGWTYDEDWNEWYSGANNLLDALLISNPYTVQADDVLSVPSWWSIENEWDFGFVQFSTDGGETWTSMSNDNTTMEHDPSAHPNIIANLPGFTGEFGDYYTLEFDLDDFITPGTEVIFGFRYMTDWAVLEAGWYIVGAFVGETELELTPVYPKPEFQVTVVEKVVWRGKERYFVHDMHIRASDNTGLKLTYARPGTVEVILIVSPVQLNGFTDYQFKTRQISIPRRFR
jgi:hypothetical protein